MLFFSIIEYSVLMALVFYCKDMLENVTMQRTQQFSAFVCYRKNPFSPQEAALLLVSTKNRDLWPSPTPEVRDSRTSRHSVHACSESSLTILIGSGLNLLCLKSHSKTECRWTRPEVAILGADQKERGLWGRECERTQLNATHAQLLEKLRPAALAETCRFLAIQ